MRRIISCKRLSLHCTGIFFAPLLFIVLLIILVPTTPRTAYAATKFQTPTSGQWQDANTITADNGETFTKLDVINNGQAMRLKATASRKSINGACLLDGLVVGPVPGQNFTSFFNATQADWIVWDANCNTNGHSTEGGQISLTNTFSNVVPTATWTGKNPGTISFDGSTYTQSSINGNDMTLTYAVADNPCTTSYTMVVKDYKNAKTAIETDTQHSSSGPPCQTNTITVTLTNTFDSAPDNGGTDNSSNKDPCPVDSNFLLRWVTCPVLDSMDSTALFINNIIGSLLAFPVGEIFSTSSGFQEPFDVFRNAGLALLVIAGLVMVIGQALDLTILEPYTVRKALPRIALAVIGISLAWPLLQFALVLTNDLGYWIGSIIISVAHAQGNGGPNNPLLFSLSGDLAGMIGLIYAAGSIFAIATPGGLLALLGTILLALLIGLLVLAFRQIVIFICIMAAPLAIASSVLPGTEKFWKFWKDTFITTLVMYPIIMAFLAAGAAMGHIAASVKTGGILMNFLAIILYIAPYFLIPFSFRLAGGLMSTIFSVANDRTKGPFDKLRNFRESEAEWLKQERMAGKTRFSNTRMGDLYRRFNTRGGISFSPAGEAKYQEGEKRRRAMLAAKAVEDEGGNVSGDDAAMKAGMRARNEAEYRTLYQQFGGRAEDVESSMGSIRSAFGEIGNDSTQLASYMALMKSVSSYNLDNPTVLAQRLGKNVNQLTGDDWKGERERVYGEMIRDTQSMVDRGLISESVGVMAVKSQPGRERAGMGFGAVQKAVRGYGKTYTAAQNADLGNDLLDASLEGTHPGAFMGGRKEQIEIGARRMAEKVKQYADDLAQAQNTGVGVGTAEEKYFTALADFMSKYKVTGQISSDRQQAFKDAASAIQITNVAAAGPPQMVPQPGGLLNANGTPVMVQAAQQPANVDVWQAGEAATDKEKYRQLVYELTGRNQAALAQYQAMQQGGGQRPGTPPPALPQGGPNFSPSDRRLKADIQHLETLESGIKLYSFRYVWGGPTYVGVMAQDLLESHPEAVYQDAYGFYSVDYSVLNLRMATLEQYESGQCLYSLRK